jgi:predicted nucleic-acid-binding protein
MRQFANAFGKSGVVAVDTNILVRLLTRDGETQYKASYALFQAKEIFIPDSVLLETEWVLRYAYDYSSAELCTAFRKLFGLENVHLTNPLLIAKVLDWHEGGLDFADALHLATSQHVTSLKTFDDRFIRRAGTLSPCVVEKP